MGAKPAQFGIPSRWQKLRAAQQRRASGAMLLLANHRTPEDPWAARFWSRRTWSEYAAVPAMSQVVLALVREGAPFEVQGAFASIAADESRHAALSQALAQRLGKYEAAPPAGSGYDPTSLADPSEVPVRVWALANGCFSETVSLALIRARTRVTHHRVIKALLEETLRDEAVHVAASWELARALLPVLPQAERSALFEYGQAMAQALRRTFGTAGLPRGSRKNDELQLRQRTALRHLGSLFPEEEDAVIEKSLEAIFSRLDQLGVRARRSAHRSGPASG